MNLNKALVILLAKEVFISADKVEVFQKNKKKPHRDMFKSKIKSNKSSSTPTPTNIALEGTATQSSTRIEGGAASRAIDGNTDGNFWAHSVTHTGYVSSPW